MKYVHKTVQGFWEAVGPGIEALEVSDDPSKLLKGYKVGPDIHQIAIKTLREDRTPFYHGPYYGTWMGEVLLKAMDSVKKHPFGRISDYIESGYGSLSKLPAWLNRCDPVQVAV